MSLQLEESEVEHRGSEKNERKDNSLSGHWSSGLRFSFQCAAHCLVKLAT